jgi:hypothetical protein
MSHDIAGGGGRLTGGRLRRIVTGPAATHGGWCMIVRDRDRERVRLRLALHRHAARPDRRGDHAVDGQGCRHPGDAGPSTRVRRPSRRRPPRGIHRRGSGAGGRSARASPSRASSRGSATSETVEAFRNLEAILEVPGVDRVFVGPNDLAISHSGANEGAGTSELDVQMIVEIGRACSRRELAAGTSCSSGENACRWQEAGFTLLALPSDAALLGAGLVDVLAAARVGAGVEAAP